MTRQPYRRAHCSVCGQLLRIRHTDQTIEAHMGPRITTASGEGGYYNPCRGGRKPPSKTNPT